MIKAYFANLFRPSSILILILLIALSAVFYFFGQMIAINGSVPFEKDTLRLGISIGIVVAYFVITFIRHLLVRRANAKLINSMLANDELVSMGGDYSADEVAHIRERFEETMELLRENPLDGKKRRNYLFQLPWYIIIGPPGTGKTTILQNSGLDFPLSDGVGKNALQGIGGTRSCDWWISNEAIMIDTAGRYTTQDVNQGLDAAAWNGFLALLKEQRKRRPINGLMLAVSIEDLALGSPDERQQLADTLRQRLRELHRMFEMRLPVYLVFTKCDLIAGFQEYFEEISENEREQVWGVTLPFNDQQMTYGHEFEREFLELIGRLEKQLPSKLAAEKSNSLRCKIYGFPHEFGAMAPVLRTFIQDVFRINRYEAQPLLRGIYFTSGTQEGTPFDRLLGSMSRSFALAPTQQIGFSGKEKAYFIKRLLTDIIFREQNLVGQNAKLERRLASLYVAGYAAVALISLGIAGYWLWGLQSSLELIHESEEQVQTVKATLEDADRQRTLPTILPALDATYKLREMVSVPGGINFNMFGIDARPELSDAAEATYDTVLDKYLLTTMRGRIQNQIQLLSSSANSNNLLLREQLEAYLMLTSGRNYSATTVQKEFDRQSEAVFALNSDQKDRMNEHTRRLAQILPKSEESDFGTIQTARSKLSQTPQAQDIYQRMVYDARERFQVPAINITGLLGAGTLKVGQTGGGAPSIVPGFYTKSGFYDIFVKQLPDYVNSTTGNDWVLGDNNLTGDAYDRIARQVTDLYVKDYIKAWNDAVTSVQVIEFETLGRGQIVLQELSQPQSPLTNLLNKLKENTEIPLPGSNQNVNGAAPAVPGAGNVLGNVKDALAETAVATAFGSSVWPGQTIGEAFTPLVSLLDTSRNTGTLLEIQQLFGDLYGTLNSVVTAPQPSGAAFEIVSQRANQPTQDSVTKLRASAATKPEPIRSMVNYIVDRNWQLMMRESYQYVNERWKQDVLPVCNSILADRYPFSLGSQQDVSLDDFSELFRPSGLIDTFVNDYLKPFTTYRGRQYVESSVQNAALGLSRDGLSQLSRAKLIQEAFFGQAGTTPETKFTIEPSFLDPKGLKTSFELDGNELIYRHGPIRRKDFTWPSQLSASKASIRLTLLDNTSRTVERNGNWSIFRLLSSADLSRSRGQDNFTFSITKDEVSATFQLRANSVVNPFNMGLYTSFRCPPSL